MALIRPLTEHHEFVEAVRLQRVIWGFEDVDLLPARLFVVASKIGGQVLGAFENSKMIGFCLSIPGLKPDGGMYLHSHMLGVLQEFRDAGIGRMLKLEQRAEALRSGVSLIEWTFDPLEIKNAYFNIEKLGAIVRRFTLNQYGTTTSGLHGGLPTDRCTAEWWLSSPRVEGILAGLPSQYAEPVARIPVPSDIEEIKRCDPDRAREIQSRIAGLFLRYASKGLAVFGFERTDEAGTYLVGPAEESWLCK
jgi:predicted GNAT superfamily acetyltransferase